MHISFSLRKTFRVNLSESTAFEILNFIFGTIFVYKTKLSLNEWLTHIAASNLVNDHFVNLFCLSECQINCMKKKENP